LKVMKRTTLLVPIVLLSGVVSLVAAAQPKFRPSNSGGAGVGRYVVTLTEEAGFDDPAALRQELAQLYGAKLDGETASSRGRQFAVTMMYARARLLSSDPRVIEVVEIPLSIEAPTPAAPPSTTASHLTPRPSSYGDNGQSGTYSYDGAGNITTIGADTFLYDSTQRLVSSVTRGVQENYTYDAYGNRTSATGAVNCLGQTNCAQTVTVDSNTNHITTINGAAVTYDAAGNISTIAATSTSPGAVYSYDATGMMTKATVGSDDRQFLYTADDERIAVRQGVSWTWMIRDQSGKVLREFTSLESGSGPTLAMTNWQWTKDYVWRDGLLLATVSPSGTLHYHLDHLGTPRLVTDANGVKVAEHAYYPFGAEINLTPHETPEEAMKFTGHERDIVAADGLTLDYMHARYDNASLGRFLSVDPTIAVQRNMHQPQGWNRYAYAMNNPLLRVDPDGRKDTVVFISMLDARSTPNIERQLNQAVRGTRFEGHVILVGPGATPGALKTWVRAADHTDIVGVLLHSGPNPAQVGGTMMGGGQHPDPLKAITGNQLAKAANDGNAPTLVIAGCSSEQCAATVSNGTGSTTFGTTARTVAGEESTGFVRIVDTLAHGGTPQDAAAAGSQEIHTLPPCSPDRPGCNGGSTDPAHFQQNPPTQ
jgi:RHS repeat-associated protein